MGFEKGKSGNPGGRSPIVTADGRSVTELAREHTADAIDCLAGVLQDQKAPPAARVAASTALLDRGWGRPKQEMEISGTTRTSVDDMNPAARAIRLASIVADIAKRNPDLPALAVPKAAHDA